MSIKKMQTGGTTTPTTEEKVQEAIIGQAGLGTTDASLPTGTELSPTNLTEQSNEILQQQTLGTAPNVSTTKAPETNLDVSVPVSPNVSTYSADVTPNTPTAQSVSGTLNSQAVIGNIQGAVSEASQATAATGTVNPKSTVRYQLEELFNDPHFAIVAEYNVKEANIDESLRDWFKKEKWVRIDTQGNIAGKCGTMPKGKATQRCLPRAKAKSLTKAQRRATARKKVRGSKKGKQFVRNTKKAKVSFKKKK